MRLLHVDASVLGARSVSREGVNLGPVHRDNAIRQARRDIAALFTGASTAEASPT